MNYYPSEVSALWESKCIPLGVSTESVIQRQTHILSFHYSYLKNNTPFKIPTGVNRVRETGALTDDSNNDHHLITINADTCYIYETYQDGIAGEAWNATSGYDYDHLSYDQPNGQSGGGTTDAAGLPILPLTVTLSDFQQGEIRHALRFTACAQCISPSALWPAISSTGGNEAAAPMGSRFRLKQSFDVSGFSPQAQIVLTALKRFGMYLADIGTIGQVQVAQDTNQDPAVARAFAEIHLADITIGQFDIVDESSLMSSPSSNRVSQSNPYVRSSSAATLLGTAADGTSITLPIAVRPIVVGVAQPTVTVQAGMSYQLRAWVSGGPSQQVTWTQLYGPGTLSATGLYTAPATAVGVTPIKFMATSALYPAAKAFITGSVIPSGSILIDVGSDVSTTDARGDVWLPDTLGMTTGAFGKINDSYPVFAWASDETGELDKTYIYTWGDDILFGPFVVPNKTYTVTFGFAKGECDGSFSTAPFDHGIAWGPVALEAQGQVVDEFDFTAAVNNQCRVPAAHSIQVAVTNHLLNVSVRATSGTKAHTAPLLNYLRIDPS